RDVTAGVRREATDRRLVRSPRGQGGREGHTMRRHAWVLAAAIGSAIGGAGLAAGQDAAGELAITEIVLGARLEEGVPTPAATSFSRSDGAVYCMVRLQNPSRQAGTLRFAFERAEGEPAERPAAGLAIEYP